MGRPERVAAVDCGTNSLRLLIVDRSESGLRQVLRTTEIVRLGEGVDQTGRLAPQALERTRRVLLHYAAAIRGHNATKTRMVATSATRDAVNQDALTELVRSILGIDPEIIGGDEEARLCFIGATYGAVGLDWPVLVVDIGGGSTELILAHSATATDRCATSLDIGSVRLTERYLHGDPPTDAEISTARGQLEKILRAVVQRCQ